MDVHLARSSACTKIATAYGSDDLWSWFVCKLKLGFEIMRRACPVISLEKGWRLDGFSKNEV
jgi:hypothetical protein